MSGPAAHLGVLHLGDGPLLNSILQMTRETVGRLIVARALLIVENSAHPLSNIISAVKEGYIR